MRVKNCLITIGLIGILIVVCGLFYFYSTKEKNNEFQIESTQQYPLLAKRIFQEHPNDIRLGFSELRTKLREYVAAQEDEDTKITVYFEYLPTGTSIKINDSTKNIAASLVKVPLAMNIYRLQENGLVDMRSEIELKQEWLDDQFGDLYKKGAGHKISIKSLIELLLIESDNTAANALWYVNDSLGGMDYDEDISNYLDIEFEFGAEETLLLGSRQYSSILKCLYFACYNSFDNSQTILNLLTKTPFDGRLRRYIDDEKLDIAHKIGVFDEFYQSDCGIFYLDKNNYLLCVMVQGNDLDSSAQIAEISRIVFSYMRALAID